MPPIHYDPVLVALSIGIAIFAAYTALELADRALIAGPDRRRAWIAAAALAMGGGIWSMHFVGMLAFRSPVPLTYGIPRTVLSLLVAVGATAAAFFWTARGRGGVAGLVVGGVLLGLAIAGMHYIGMSAMRMPMEMGFDPVRVALSVGIAVVASIAGLAIAFRRTRIGLRLLAAVVMGLAVAGMHYTGMWAAHFGAAAADDIMPVAPRVPSTADALAPQGLALWVVAATFVILFLAMLLSTLSQQRAQKALRRSEARFRIAAEAVGDIIWTTAPQGGMEGRQPSWARFTGQDAAGYAGTGWTAAIHPDDRAETEARWMAALRTRTPYTMEHRVRRADGAWRLCAVRGVPVLDDDGTVREWVGVHEDVTAAREAAAELRDARDRAEAASRVKSQFIANMSHELRTPLTAIIGYNETVQEEIEDGGIPAPLLAELRADLGRIEANARHLLGLISDILDLSKIEAGRMDVAPVPIDAAALARQVAETLQDQVQRNANRLRIELPDGPIGMHSDAVKLRQMLLNLVGNAAKFTRAGTVTLSAAHEPGGLVRFDVADTGIGMNEEELSRVFERFSQADLSTTRRFGGTGLGLALTRAYATLLGGTIEVRSTPGAGSTFTVKVPATWAAPAA